MRAAGAACAANEVPLHGIVLTAGSVLRADDAAGPVLARRFEEHPVPGWYAIDGGQTPEDDIVEVKRVRPERLVLVDAADMGLAAGAVRRLDRADVVARSFFTTHALPLTLLIDELAPYCGELSFLGIQPASLEFFGTMTPAVADAVTAVHAAVAADGDIARFPRLAPAVRARV